MKIRLRDARRIEGTDYPGGAVIDLGNSQIAQELIGWHIADRVDEKETSKDSTKLAKGK